MKIDLSYTPVFTLRCSMDELDKLIAYSRRHYDGTCRAMSKEDGKLTIWKKKLTNGFDFGENFTFREVDILSKVIENEKDMAELSTMIRRVVNAHNEKMPWNGGGLIF